MPFHYRLIERVRALWQWLQSFVEDDFPVFASSVFPPRDLLDTLVSLYFHHMNSHFPLLHEPTFKTGVRSGQHLLDGGFGATVLLVCAVGSRFTRDPRVVLPESGHPHSVGWQWFRAVEKERRLSFAPARLHDLQVYAVRGSGPSVPPMQVRCGGNVSRCASVLLFFSSWPCFYSDRTLLGAHGRWSGRASGPHLNLVCIARGCTPRRRTSRRSFGVVLSGTFLWQ